jgi:hypothetical protein
MEVRRGGTCVSSTLRIPDFRRASCSVVVYYCGKVRKLRTDFERRAHQQVTHAKEVRVQIEIDRRICVSSVKGDVQIVESKRLASYAKSRQHVV